MATSIPCLCDFSGGVVEIRNPRLPYFSYYMPMLDLNKQGTRYFLDYDDQIMMDFNNVPCSFVTNNKQPTIKILTTDIFDQLKSFLEQTSAVKKYFMRQLPPGCSVSVWEDRPDEIFVDMSRHCTCNVNEFPAIGQLFQADLRISIRGIASLACAREDFVILLAIDTLIFI
jgi:hypothetical protein